MYVFIIPVALYLLLAYFLYPKNKYLTFMALYAALYFVLMFLLSSFMNDNFLKIYYSLALFVDAIGIYIVSYIIIGKKTIIYTLTGIFLLLAFIGTYMTTISDIHIMRIFYFFEITVPEPLWSYTLYAIFYPGLIIIFFLLLIGLEGIDTPYGRRIITVSLLALTFGLILFYSIVDPLYALIYFVVNVLGAGIMLLWEVKTRYL